MQTLADMNDQPLSKEAVAKIFGALKKSWSEETSSCFNPKIAPLSYGQCAPTAIVVFEHFGGEILKTEVAKRAGGSIRHFYNRIGGHRYDFTRDQFDIPHYWCELKYRDESSSVNEALTETYASQADAMRRAFAKALAEENGG
jgi:hypothetical protein